MKLNYLTRRVSLVAVAALLIVAAMPATVRAQPLEGHCADETNCPTQALYSEITGEPTIAPQPETPVQLEPELSSVQVLPKEITFDLSVSTALRVLNDLSSAINLN
jgi:hypothetical protein